MKDYIVERVDVSFYNVQASSSEEALQLAEQNPDEWNIVIGDTTVMEDK